MKELKEIEIIKADLKRKEELLAKAEQLLYAKNKYISLLEKQCGVITI